MNIEQPNTINDEKDKFNNTKIQGKVARKNIYLLIISIILLLILAFNIFTYINSRQLSDARLQAINSAERFLTYQSEIIDDLIFDYEETIYTNESVDNIYQQLFLSQEYTFVVLQIIAEQNTHIIELLSTLP